MAGHVFRRIDPAPDELCRVLNDAYLRASAEVLVSAGFQPNASSPPSWDRLLAEAQQPAGTFAEQYSLDWRCATGVVVGACWWSDVVGRKHWYIEGSRNEVGCRLLHLVQVLSGVWTSLARPEIQPLEWIAPELAFVWRTRNGQHEPAVVCECGVAGSPQELGWAGTCCGPCFDRRQDGEVIDSQPVARRNLGYAESFLLATDGRLILARPAKHQVAMADGTSIRVCAPPWTAASIWARNWSHADAWLLANNDIVLALSTPRERLTLVSLEDGNTRDVIAPDHGGWFKQAVFAGLRRDVLVCFFMLGGDWGLQAWECTAQGRIKRELYRRKTSHGSAGVAVSPLGRLIVHAQGEELHVLEVATGDTVERLRLSESLESCGQGLTYTPDGAIVASAKTRKDTHVLARWGPSSADSKGQGWLRGLRGAPRRFAEVRRELTGPVDSLTCCPKGQALLVTGNNKLSFFDAHSLEEIGQLTPPGKISGPPALTAAGEVLVLVDGRLAVWPWRTLFGLPARL